MTGRGRPRPVRIYDVAGKAGVSLATVSAVTTGNRPVASATRERVLQAIADLGYHANANARALAGGCNHTLALLVPPVNNWQTAMEMFATMLVECASQHGYNMLVSVTGADDDAALGRLVAEQRVDGVLLLEVSLTDRRVARLRSLEFPFVAIGRTADFRDFDSVDIDFELVVASCVKRLADLGHRRLALFNSSQTLYELGHGPTCRAERGFFKMCRRRGVQGTVVRCERSGGAGFAEMSALLARPDHATGIVASNALTVPGIYRGVRAAALRIPEDISVMAIAERCALAGIEPSVTVMGHAVAEMAHQAIQLMVTRIAQPALPARTVLVRGPLEVGESTARAPGVLAPKGP